MIIDQAVNSELATVSNQGFGTNPNTGSLYFRIDFIFDYLKGDGNEDVTISKYKYFTEKTTEESFEFFLKELSVLGWNGKDIDDLNPKSPNYHSLIGKKANLTVEIKPYKGKPRAEVKYINDPNYQPNVSADEKQIKDLSEKLRGKIAAFRSRNPVKTTPVKATAKPNAPKPSSEEPPAEDDDVEF